MSTAPSCAIYVTQPKALPISRAIARDLSALLVVSSDARGGGLTGQRHNQIQIAQAWAP